MNNKEQFKEIFKMAVEKVYSEIALQKANNIRLGKIVEYNSLSQTADIEVFIDKSVYKAVPVSKEITGATIGDRCLVVSPDPSLKSQIFVTSVFGRPSSAVVSSSGGTVYTTTYTGVQGVTGGGNFTANRQFAFYGDGVTITNSILTGNSLGLNINTGGSYSNPMISGGTINNSFITSNSVISSWTGLTTGVSVALITGTSPVYLMRAYGVDLRNTIEEGTRHYFTQNGLTKYFLSITGASLNGSDSDFYLLSRLDTGTTTYSIFGASFAISNYFYSREKAPVGFPMESSNWTMFSAGSTGSQATPVSGTVYNLGGNIVVPKGSWKLSYQAVSWCTRASTGLATMSIGLGLSTNSIDLGYMYQLGNYPVNPNSTQRTTFSWTSKTPVNLTVKTTYHLNAKVNAASHDPLVIANVDEGILGLWAECNYL